MKIASTGTQHIPCGQRNAVSSASHKLTLDRCAELIIDNFAGGGGASTGIELGFKRMGLNREVNIAINHDGEALAMHEANHPNAKHFKEDVFDIHPGFVTGHQPIGLAWFSPDCKHHSRAKGGKPREQKIRGLAWVALKWGALQYPRVMILENVEEFAQWGPLDRDGNAIKSERGRTFRAFIAALTTGVPHDHPDVAEIYSTLGSDFPITRLFRGLGYKVDWRALRACDFGAPTTRKRLFLVARHDGIAIEWPLPTHGDPKSEAVKCGRLLPFRTAAECIDWSIPCPSIFDRKKPLAENTLRRVARGLKKFVIDSANPFIVQYHAAKRDGDDRVADIDAPLPTQTTENRFALVVPTLVQTGYGERTGQAPRVLDIGTPLGTVVAGGAKHALVAAFLAKHYTGVDGSDVRNPLGTVTTIDHHSLVMAHLVQMGHGEQSATGAKRWGAGINDIRDPLITVTASGCPAALVTSNLVKLRGDNTGQRIDEPIHTISAQGTHHAEVRAFLVKYYGSERDGVSCDAPLHTIRTNDCFGLVMVKGAAYQIVDIGLRMLSPRELALCQGFDSSYMLTPLFNGMPLTKKAQTRMIGNSVSPEPAAALVQVNFRHELSMHRPEQVAA